MIDLKNLRHRVRAHRATLAEIEDDKQWGFNLPWDQFVYGVSQLSPQSYGSRIQHRLEQDLSLQAVSMFEDRGDAETILRDSIEIKSSIIINERRVPLMNVVQLRPFQAVDGYLFAVFDLRYADYKADLFRLRTSDLKKEIEMGVIRLAAAHGTATANERNENVEYRFSMDINSPAYQRWRANYGLKNRNGTPFLM